MVQVVTGGKHRGGHRPVSGETLDGHPPTLRLSHVILKVVEGPEAQGDGHLVPLEGGGLDTSAFLQQVRVNVEVDARVVFVLLGGVFLDHGQSIAASGRHRTTHAGLGLASLAPHAAAADDVLELDGLALRVAVALLLQTETLFGQLDPIDGLLFVEDVERLLEEDGSTRLNFAHLAALPSHFLFIKSYPQVAHQQ